jgi:hypothetical protein
MEWEVWLADGTTRTSSNCTWSDVPNNGILVVRVWNKGGTWTNWINWDDGVYGDPSTWKGAGMTDDITFNRVLSEAREVNRIPPSER